ncbi:FGGY family carbohydrate kinase [Nocardioides mesophilus]|uniref:Carbohydrate kinase FGGY N-terminal domain-containing protein n=1 Tax=Nocardioides mesophilus TaxID=433659 RepID=A0A7G9RC10_9ACTN|nr:FGGY family carbohydrate kinase [Nocardioides mesophilus]QNN53135.1 hypothetical protein H9L09_01135 [Nocardioides mesophilus]
MPFLEVHVAVTDSTCEVSAGLLDGDGPRSPVRRPVPVTAPRPGWQELAPEDLWRATTEAVRELLDRPGVDAAEVEGLVLTGPPETLVVWDQETLGSPRPVIGPADRRTAELCTWMRSSGSEKLVGTRTGRGLDPTGTGPRLAWVRAHEPNTWALVEDGRYVVGPVTSYLVARMTRGVWHLVDTASAAATLLLDTTAGTWDPELCALFGVPAAALPQLVEPGRTPAVTDPSTVGGLAVPIGLR